MVLSHCKEIMHKRRSMTYPLGLSMDPTKGGLALQGAHHGHVGGHEFAFDPGFTERAAKFSTFGSSTVGYNLQHQSQPYSLYDTTLSEPDCQHSSSSASFSAAARVSHSGARDRSQHLSELASEFEHPNPPEGLGIQPGLEAFEGAKNSRGTAKVLVNNNNNNNNEYSELGEAHEISSCSGQPGKRKISSPESLVDVETTCTRDSKDDEVHAKCLKAHGVGMNEADELKPKTERSASEQSGDSSPRSLKANSKTSEPSKLDYIHVRARRGQATDSHSLAERVRREKISERMKFLQDLVPGCSKVTGKAVMLDEIINYVQSLQRQIEFLSMKLAAVNPRPEFNFDTFLNKETMMQTRSPETTLMGPDPLPGACSYGEPQYQRQMLQQQILPGSCSLDFRTVGTACDAYLRLSSSVQVPASLQVSPEAYSDPLSQTEGLCDGDLQSVVEMGFIHNRQGSLNQGLHGLGFMLPGNLKVEL